MWCKYGEQTGHAIAFLWLADLYWRHGKLENATRYCERAIEHIPNGPAPVYRIAKAVAHYMCGLSYQMSGEMSAAFASYQEAVSYSRRSKTTGTVPGTTTQTIDLRRCLGMDKSIEGVHQLSFAWIHWWNRFSYDVSLSLAGKHSKAKVHTRRTGIGKARQRTGDKTESDTELCDGSAGNHGIPAGVSKLTAIRLGKTHVSWD